APQVHDLARRLGEGQPGDGGVDVLGEDFRFQLEELHLITDVVLRVVARCVLAHAATLSTAMRRTHGLFPDGQGSARRHCRTRMDPWCGWGGSGRGADVVLVAPVSAAGVAVEDSQ